MARRWRVMRRPRALSACWRRPVVSAVLMRSPVEARWVEEAMVNRWSWSPWNLRGSPKRLNTREPSTVAGRAAASRACRGQEYRRLGVAWKPPQNVMIHDDGEEHQKEDQADLDVTLLEG